MLWEKHAENEALQTRPAERLSAGRLLKFLTSLARCERVCRRVFGIKTGLTGDEAKDSYFALIAAGVLVDKHFGEQADAWCAERAKSQANSPPPPPPPQSQDAPQAQPQAA